jgi:hypothetical protein
MRSFRLLAVAVLAVVLVLSSAQNGFAAVIDQRQESTYGGSVQILEFSPVGQEFQPSLPILEGVEVQLSSPFGGPDDTITLNIRQGSVTGTVLATATKFLTTGPSNWVYFTLGSISVVPGATYVIELAATQVTFRWDSSSFPAYPRGDAIWRGNPNSMYDFCFRTYGSEASYSSPVGGFMEPVNKLTVFAPYLALFGLVVTIAIVVTAPWNRPDN